VPETEQRKTRQRVNHLSFCFFGHRSFIGAFWEPCLGEQVLILLGKIEEKRDKNGAGDGNRNHRQPVVALVLGLYLTGI
jgi:hypothetical protein